MADQEQSVERIFGAALDLPAEQRAAFLDRACRNAPEVRELVEQLLHEEEQLGTFLDTPVFRGNDASLMPTLAPTSTTLEATPYNGSADPPPRFEAGHKIANRFVVVRFLARGGMGEVYEVQDELLQSVNVALKIIRPEIAADAGSLHRFEQEVILARKVTHPNLCPIYEIFRCDEPAPAFMFLTMKLLLGETLDVRLKTHTALPPQEATEVCTQIIRGVAAMHAADVVHRDLKPNNVMLEGTPAGLHVSIMDFGLARIHEAEVTVLKPGMIAGTPGYLAPELLRGQLPSKATDLFALGVVLHQVLTGSRPIPSRDGFSMQPASSLRVANAPAHFIQAVQGLLQDDPERRCEAFDHVYSLTNGQPSRLQTQARSQPRALTRRHFLYGASAAVCVAAGGAAWRHQQIYDLVHPLPTKRFVALLTWPPSSDAGMKPMLNGVIDAIANELARVEAFDHNFFVISQQFIKEVTTASQLNDVRESLGANLVLAASGVGDVNTLRLKLQVLDPVSSKALRHRDLALPRGEEFQLPERAVRAAAELLSVAQYEPNERRSHVGTDNPEALTAYQTAQTLMKEPNDTGLDQAVERYKQALEADPHFAVAQAKLSWAYLRSFGLHGDAATLSLARANCESAIAIDPNLVDAHLALAWVLEQSGDRPAAAAEMARALAIDPSNAHTLVYQARFYADNAQYRQAGETFQRVLKLRPNNWLAHNEFGVLLDDEGKYAEALLQFRMASAAAPKNALAFSNVGSVYLQQGKLDDAIQALGTSLKLEPNDPAAAGLAAAWRIRRRYPDAIGYAQQAVKLGPSTSSNWLELGDCFSAAGKLSAEAKAAYKSGASAEEEELSTKQSFGPGWILLALCRIKMGEPETAGGMIKKAEMLRAEDITSELYKVRVLELLGRRDEALTAVDRCFARGATAFQLQTMPDLDKLRADPRFGKSIRSTPSAA